MVSGLLVGIENPNAGLKKKPAQNRFIVRTLSPDGESRAQFSKRDERQSDFLCRGEGFNHARVSATEIGVGGWYRAPASAPHLLIDSVLLCQRALKGAIFAPSAHNILEIALWRLLSDSAGTSGKSFKRYVVEAPALLLRTMTEAMSTRPGTFRIVYCIHSL